MLPLGRNNPVQMLGPDELESGIDGKVLGTLREKKLDIGQQCAPEGTQPG